MRYPCLTLNTSHGFSSGSKTKQKNTKSKKSEKSKERVKVDVIKRASDEFAL
jgi:hypothetical protein